MEPLLIDLPTELTTARLQLRVPRFGDGPAVTALVRASLAELKPWMPWATDGYADRDGELWSRRAAGQFLLRQEVQFMIFADGGDTHVGNVGLFGFDWAVPECEVGYWLGTPFVGRGYMAEAVRAVVGLAFGPLGVRRVRLQCKAANVRSRRTAERAGFALEGVRRQIERDITTGEWVDACLYAVVR